MATYVIGDIQGCFRSFIALLARVGFDRSLDRSWLAGDLVNRGPRALEVLRWVYRYRDAITMVLGNHDLHLLACHFGVQRNKRRDTLDEVLAAPERDPLIEWLLGRPLLHREGSRLLVHAGLLPEWTVAEAERRARAVERELRGAGAARLLGAFEVKPENPRLAALADDLAVFTGVRMLGRDGRPHRSYKGAPEEAPAELTAWFQAEPRRYDGITVLFGHWAALGRRVAPPFVALDSGCVWGGELTAYRLEDGEVFVQPAVESG